jgi:hypothetical protein
MDPFVVIIVGKQQWRSAVCVNGGKNPHWQMQVMDIPVKKLRKLEKIVTIEVRDKDILHSEPIGHAQVPLAFFASRGPVEEWIELKYRGFPAGRIHMKSTFTHLHGAGVVVVQQQP